MAASVGESLVDQLLQLDGSKDCENSRFTVPATEEKKCEFIKSMRNANTKRKTKNDVQKDCRWLLEVG